MITQQGNAFQHQDHFIVKKQDLLGGRDDDSRWRAENV